MTDYDALRAAAEAATPGPWGAEPPSKERATVHHIIRERLTGPQVANVLLAEDAAYIAAVSPDVLLELLDELDEAAAPAAPGLDIDSGDGVRFGHLTAPSPVRPRSDRPLDQYTALRAAAEAAHDEDEAAAAGMPVGATRMRKFRAAASPDVILALLDELDENKSLFRQHFRDMVESERRVAALEGATLGLLDRLDSGEPISEQARALRLLIYSGRQP